jgi:hypothetical protein
MASRWAQCFCTMHCQPRCSHRATSRSTAKSNPCVHPCPCCVDRHQLKDLHRQSAPCTFQFHRSCSRLCCHTLYSDCGRPNQLHVPSASPDRLQDLRELRLSSKGIIEPCLRFWFHVSLLMLQLKLQSGKSFALPSQIGLVFTH